MAKRKSGFFRQAQFDLYKTQRDWEQENPQPKRPVDPRKIEEAKDEDGAVRLIKHTQDGGLWVEAGYSRFDSSSAPRLTIHIAINDEVRVIHIAAQQQPLLWAELERCKTTLAVIQQEQEDYRESLTRHDEEYKTWLNARDSHVQSEREAFEAAQAEEDVN